MDARCVSKQELLSRRARYATVKAGRTFVYGKASGPSSAFESSKKKGAGIRTESMGYPDPDLYDRFSTEYLDSVVRRDEFGDSRRRYSERSTGEKFGDLNKEEWQMLLHRIPVKLSIWGLVQVDGPKVEPHLSWRFVSKSRGTQKIV